jgi:predicted Co/Zn/Cd cation transporter (cation efflux family)
LFNKINKGEYPPLDNRYSEPLRILIDMMLKVSPDERIDLKEVLKECENELKKKPKIDPYLIMDDIMEKLKLLDYENDFCTRFGRDKIVRIYFAFKDTGDEAKVEYFFDLCYWLMSFPGSSKRVRRVAFSSFQNK